MKEKTACNLQLSKKKKILLTKKGKNVGGSSGAWGTVVALLDLALWMMLPVGVGSGVVAVGSVVDVRIDSCFDVDVGNLNSVVGLCRFMLV